jgi:hypothetical protein
MLLAMDFSLHSHRNALEIAESANFRKDWESFRDVISSVSDHDLKTTFRALGARREGRRKEGQKSLSHAINEVLRKKLGALGWDLEPTLFSKDKAGLGPSGWKLDFVKRLPNSRARQKSCTFAVEVAFNHSEAAAWVLTKLALACERATIPKDIDASIGILVVMQSNLKKAGNFDGSCCTYDRYIHTIKVMHDLLRAPLLVVGLGPPKTFRLKGHARGVRIVGVIEDV